MTNYRFNCHAFLDNTNLCVVEISISSEFHSGKSHHWLLVHKATLQVTELILKSRDNSNLIEERFFDLGYLKYNAAEGIFIASPENQLHPLDLKDCSGIPQRYLQSIETWFSQSGELKPQPRLRVS